MYLLSTLSIFSSYPDGLFSCVRPCQNYSSDFSSVALAINGGMVGMGEAIGQHMAMAIVRVSSSSSYRLWVGLPLGSVVAGRSVDISGPLVSGSLVLRLLGLLGLLWLLLYTSNIFVL